MGTSASRLNGWPHLASLSIILAGLLLGIVLRFTLFNSTIELCSANPYCTPAMKLVDVRAEQGEWLLGIIYGFIATLVMLLAVTFTEIETKRTRVYMWYTLGCVVLLLVTLGCFAWVYQTTPTI